MNALISTVIADDEPIARDRLRAMLEALGGFSIVGEASNGADALAKVAETAPQLLLLDVEMPLLDGVSAAERLGVKGRPLVVFVTAYDRFAVRAFALDAADYLLKPYDAERLAAMATRVSRRLSNKPADGVVTPRQHLLAFSHSEARLLSVAAIEYIVAAGNYAEVVMFNDSRYLVREPISNLAVELGPPFVRVSRSTIIRTDRIVAARSAGHGDVDVRLADGGLVRVSRRYRAALGASASELLSRSSLI